ncbi:PREDICTED: S-antigen protein [Theobroma cacao]|uniref:S-antigen protein n=1 Tax=Theobroma cacao TaxID=3641 RepID=A0AB32WC93_THECC|nr:PREDICTED: S-antigen protein [Theobroma cacao]
MSTEDDTAAAALVEEALTEDADSQAKKPPRRESSQSLSHEQDINVNDHTSTESVFHAEHMFLPPSTETPNQGSTLSSGHSIGNLNNSLEASNDYLLPQEGVGSCTKGESVPIQFDSIVPTNPDKRKATWQDSTPPPPKLPFINLMTLGQGNQGRNSLTNQDPNTPGNEGLKSPENRGLTTFGNQDLNTLGNQGQNNSVPLASGSRSQGYGFQASLNQVMTSNYSHLNDDTPHQFQRAKLPIRRGVRSNTEGVSSPIQFDGIVPNNPNKRKMTWRDSTPPPPKLRFINWMLPRQGNQGKNSLGNQDQNSPGNQDPNTLDNPSPKSPETQSPKSPGSESPKSFENQGQNIPVNQDPKTPENQGLNTLGNQDQKSPGNQDRNTPGNVGPNNSVPTTSGSRNFKSISYFIMSTEDNIAAAASAEEAVKLKADSQEDMEGKADKAGADESNKSGVNQPDGNQHLNQSPASIYMAERNEEIFGTSPATSPRIHSLLTSPPLQQAGTLPSIYNSIKHGVGSSTKGKSSPIQFDGIVPSNPDKRKMTWQDSTPSPPKLPLINLMLLGQGNQSQINPDNQGPKTPGNQGRVTSGNQGSNTLDNQGVKNLENQSRNTPSNQCRSNSDPTTFGSRSQGLGFQTFLNQLMPLNGTPQLQPAKLPIRREVGSSTKGISSPIQFDGIVPTNPNKRKMTRQDSTPPPPKIPFINWMLPGQGNQDENSSGNQSQNTHGNQGPKSLGNQESNTFDNQGSKSPRNQGSNTLGNQGQKSLDNEGRNTPNNEGQNKSVPTASGSRSKAIPNKVYDPSYEAMGLPVDPHLRMFLARCESAENKDSDKKDDGGSKTMARKT